MEEGDFRSWDELIPDALGLIFNNLSLEETLTVVPRVCISWRKAAMDPFCWQEIDIEEWSYRSNTDEIERMLRILIARSAGSMRTLCVSNLPDDEIFSFITEHSRSLQKLRVPFSNMSESIVEQVASRLSSVTFLDLSYCGRIGARALSAIGKNCKSLAALCWNMHPLDSGEALPHNDGAHTIATTMPKLTHLELAYHGIDNTSIMKILYGCSNLEYLDLRGCWAVDLDSKWLFEKFPKLKVMGPHVLDNYVRNDWEDCSDYTDSFYDYESLDEGWDEDDERIGGLELRFFEGYDQHSGFGWPPSP